MFRLSPRIAHSAVAFVAALTIAALSDCADNPVQPPSARTHPPMAASQMSVPGATVVVHVDVPANMRTGTFSTDRSLMVPANFGIAVYARVDGARFMAVAPNGDLLVSQPGASRIMLVRPSPSGGDPAVSTWASGLYLPHDIVFHRIAGTTYVYVAEGDKVARYTYTDGDATGQGRQVVISGLPSASLPELQGSYRHELKNIALDASHNLYVSIASSCNACASDTQSDPVRGAIYVYNADGSGGRLFARGLRNAEGLAFVPGTSTLWATVNNRDDIEYPFHGDITGDGVDDYGRVVTSYVDDHPPDEFTRVRDGANYGWPFCNPNPDTPAGMDNMPFDLDVELNATGSSLDCTTAERINKGIQAHSAPLGLTFLQNTAVPAPYNNGAAVALHGSWDRSRNTGYKVVFFPWDPATNGPGAQADLVSGWGTETDHWGRPVDVAVDAAGAILISDDQSGTIYKLSAVATPSGTATPLIDNNSGKCLDVYGAGQSAGTPVIIYSCHGGTNQQFIAPAVGSGELRVYGTMCLGPASGQSGNGTAVVIAPCDGTPAQRWTRTAASEFRAVDGRCLDVFGRRTDNLTTVWLWDCLGAPNQQWTIGGTSPPPRLTNVEFIGRASGKCLDIYGAGHSAGTPAIIYSCLGNDNQRFNLPAVGTTGEIRAYGGSMCLGPSRGDGQNGDPIVVQPCQGTATQQWARLGNGEMHAANGKCMDVFGQRTDNLTTVWLWDCLGADNQRWDPHA